MIFSLHICPWANRRTNIGLPLWGRLVPPAADLRGQKNRCRPSNPAERNNFGLFLCRVWNDLEVVGLSWVVPQPHDSMSSNPVRSGQINRHSSIVLVWVMCPSWSSYCDSLCSPQTRRFIGSWIAISYTSRRQWRLSAEINENKEQVDKLLKVLFFHLIWCLCWIYGFQNKIAKSKGVLI